MDKNKFQCAKTLAPIILNKQCQKATKIENDHLWLAPAITIIAPIFNNFIILINFIKTVFTKALQARKNTKSAMEKDLDKASSSS